MTGSGGDAPADRWVRNRADLLDRGARAPRRLLLDVADDALDRLRPDRLVGTALEPADGTRRLRAGGRTVEVGDRDVHLLAVGKGATAFAAAAIDRLPPVASGLVVDEGTTDGPVGVGPGGGGTAPSLDPLETVAAGHPLPDDGSRAAGRRLAGLADGLDGDDLVVAVVTGGASALVAAPAGDLTLADLRATTDALLSAGAPIEDVNAVRKHLSTLKGGRLAARLAPATVLTLVAVDEVGGEPWGPTVPDPTTYDDALAAVDRHGPPAGVPDAVVSHLRAGAAGDRAETPTADDLDAAGAGDRATVVLAAGADACDAAAAAARDRGLRAAVLSASVEGESREVGRALSAIAREVHERGRPVEPPCVLVSGGETTVSLGGGGMDTDEGREGGTGDAGGGGPNGEFALAAAREIRGLEGVAALAIDTDGTDGPTRLAGGLVDSTTARRAREAGVDVDAALREHASAGALRALGDAVRLAPGTTNLMDLRLFYVG